MTLKIHRIEPEPLDAEAFAPFGDVLLPKGQGFDNRGLLEFARLSDEMAPERLDDFDVLDYWGDIATITQEPMRLGYLRPKRRPFAFSWFERHLKGTQTFVPLDGAPAIIAVAGPSDLANPADLPDLASVRAFRMDGRTGVNLRPGTWHWTPFPVGERADFIIVVRTDVAEDDLNFVDLEARLGTRVEIAA